MAPQAKRDYYEILGVGRAASEQEIENAFQRLVLEIRNAGGPEVIDGLLAARKAHTVLMNPKKRARYDQTGEDGFDDFKMCSSIRQKIDDQDGTGVDVGFSIL